MKVETVHLHYHNLLSLLRKRLEKITRLFFQFVELIQVVEIVIIMFLKLDQTRLFSNSVIYNKHVEFLNSFGYSNQNIFLNFTYRVLQV
jgi:hypothetical protein